MYSVFPYKLYTIYLFNLSYVKVPDNEIFYVLYSYRQ